MAEKFNENDVPVQTLKTRIEETKKFRKKYEDNWDENRDYFEGNQWGDVERIAWFQSEPVFNKIFEFVEMNRAYLSDNQWGVDVVPARLPKKLENAAKDLMNSAPDQLAATQEAVGIDPMAELLDMVDRVNKLLDFMWVDSRMKSKLAEVILYVFLYGTGFIKSTFDVNNVSDAGIGQIENKVLSPWYIFPDPNATNVHDASFIFEHHPVTLRWIIERYPEKAQEVKDSGVGSTTEYNERQGNTGRGPADNSEAKKVDIWECWYLDSTILEDEETGDYTLKYPNGRMTLMTEGGIILEDKENPYQSFPYVRFIEAPRPGEFFGDCTVNRLVPIQNTINQILRTIIDNGLWLVHGIWITDATSGVTPDALAGYGPRDVLVKNPGTELRREGGEQLPQHLFEMLRQQEEAFDRVAGITNALRGIVPSRQPVATTQMQQEAGEVRTRERQRRIEESLEDLARLWLDIASEHWQDNRVIRNKRVLGGFEMFEMSKKDLQEWKFDVHVVPGSTSPMDTTQQLEKAFQLIERGGVQIPPMYLVETSNLPNLYSAMLSSMNEEVPAEQAPIDGEAPMEAQVPEGQHLMEDGSLMNDADMEQPLPEDALPIPSDMPV